MHILKTASQIVATLLLFIITLGTVYCDDNVFVTLEELPGPGSNTSVVGPPGPPGPVGLPGSKGTTGRIGTCQCDIERVERQKSLVEIFKGTTDDNKAKTVLFEFKQNADSCSVGIKTGQLPDSAMTASTFTSIRFAPYRARLDNLSQNGTNYGAWQARESSVDNWIQVAFDEPRKITGIITQGYQYYDVWISSFKISYSNQTDGINFIQEGRRDKIFTGNHDRATYKINIFPEPITARYFRLYVITFNSYVVLRMELLTC